MAGKKSAKQPLQPPARTTQRSQPQATREAAKRKAAGVTEGECWNSEEDSPGSSQQLDGSDMDGAGGSSEEHAEHEHDPFTGPNSGSEDEEEEEDDDEHSDNPMEGIGEGQEGGSSQDEEGGSSQDGEGEEGSGLLEDEDEEEEDLSFDEEEEEEEEGQGDESEDESDYGEEHSDGEEDEERQARQQRAGMPPAKFLEGQKGASFAKAFSKILDSKSKAGSLEVKQEKEGAVEGQVAAILADSKSVAKRKAAEQEAAKVNRAAKKLRMEMRQRGHVKVAKKGQDPVADQKEKQLMRLATRGVVLLFNAVAKSQKQQQEAGAGKGAKAARLNKASFLMQLKGAAETAGGVAQPAAAGGAGVLGLVGSAKSAGKAQQGAGAPAWRVLQDDYSGLPGSKMKDWDKEQDDDSDGPAPEAIQAASDDDGDEDGGNEGW